MATLQVLHGDIRQAALFTDIVNRHDVRMIEPARGFSFAKEARSRLDQLSIAELAAKRDGFDRHHAIYRGIASEINHSHCAAADFPLELIPAEPLGFGDS